MKVILRMALIIAVPFAIGVILRFTHPAFTKQVSRKPGLYRVALARRDLRVGTMLSGENVRWKVVDAAHLPAVGTFHDEKELSGLVVREPIYTWEIVVAPRVSADPKAREFSSLAGAGRLALPLTARYEGDEGAKRVDAFVEGRSEPIARNLTLLALDDRIGEGSSAVRVATLAVEKDAVADLVLASDAGTLHLKPSEI